MMMDAVMVWSGGKDSALALHRVLQLQTYRIRYLLTTFSAAHQRVTMHGVRKELIEAQAKSMGIPLWPVFIPEDVNTGSYETVMYQAFLQLKSLGIQTAIFGDIFLEDLKLYREKQLALAQLAVYFPLWNEPTPKLVQEFVDLKFGALLVCVSDMRLGVSYLAREIDADFLKNLPIGTDPAGENGEYHSFVYDGPMFKEPILFQRDEIVLHDYGTTSTAQEDTLNYDTRFWFLELLPPSTPYNTDPK